MKIFLFYFFIFSFSISIYSMEYIIDKIDQDKKEILSINFKKNFNTKKNNIDIYYPNYQDYKFWTEKNQFKKNLLEIESFSIKKYYYHDFFKNDNFGLFYNIGNGQNFLIPNSNFEKKNIYNFQKILFFKDPFFYREKIQYFDVKTPISEIFYKSNLFQEKILGGFFSQNPNEKINYSIEYKNLHLKNEFFLEKNQELLLMTFNYQDRKNKNIYDFNYKLWGHYIKQKFFFKEKEEIIKWNNIKNYKNVFFDQKKLINDRFYISFFKNIFSKKNQSFFVKTYMEYEKYHKSHLFSEQDNKINHFFIKNGLFLIFQKNDFNIELGSIFDKIHYQLFFNKYYNKNRLIPKNKYINNFSLETKINYPINNIIKLYSFGKYMIISNNFKKPYLHMNIKFHIFLFSKFYFLTQFHFFQNKGYTPDFIHLYILKENEDCYNNKRKNMLVFDQEKIINFSLFNHKNYDISFSISKLDHSFIDDKKEMEKFLYRKYLQLYSFVIKTTHNIWRYKVNNLFLYQKYDSNPLIFSLPNFLSRNTIFYENSFFKKNLLMKTGFSIHYFSSFYYQKIYYPFDIHVFSSEKECYPNKTGKNFFIDYFCNFKLHKTIFYFSIKNIGFHYKNFFKKKELFIETGLLWTLFT
ncbi:putative porin [Blattabacterium cuenoti]|uniref:putative porin n=1 Tax=Blattabacterium cuenoti TaxID=1653831 RepID=UPI00163C27A5|nr:putative porin [Blattabacterium cuenoti]